jgi:hypothetical protein
VLPKITLPDGKIIDIPSNLSASDKNLLKQKIAQKYANYTPKGESVSMLDLGRYGYALKNVGKGAVETALSGASGLASLVDIGNDNPLTQDLQKLEDRFRQSTASPLDAKYGDLFTSKVGSGVGSFATFGAPRIASTLLRSNKAFSPANLDRADSLAKYTGLGIAGGSGAKEQASGINEKRNEGKEIGAIREILAESIGGVIGLGEMYPIEKLFKRIPNNPEAKKVIQSGFSKLYPKLAGATATARNEAIQETVAGIAQDLLARGLYDEDREVLNAESIWDNLTVGGATGFIADLTINALMPGRVKKDANIEDIDKKDEVDKTIEESEKFVDSSVPIPKFNVVESGESEVVPTFYEDSDVKRIKKKDTGFDTTTDYETTDKKWKIINTGYQAGIGVQYQVVEVGTGQEKDIGRLGGDRLPTFFKLKEAKEYLRTKQKGEEEIKSYNVIDENNGLIYNSISENNKEEGLDFDSAQSLQERLQAVSSRSETLRDAKNQSYDSGAQNNTTQLIALIQANSKVGKNISEPDVLAESYGLMDKGTKEKDINSILQDKNIKENINKPSDNFSNYLKAITGESSFSKMNNQQKAIVLRRLIQLPTQRELLPMIDVRPNLYSSENINKILEDQDRNYIKEVEKELSATTNKKTKIKTKNKQYSKQEIKEISGVTSDNALDQMIGRLVESGRLTKNSSGKYEFFKEGRNLKDYQAPVLTSMSEKRVSLDNYNKDLFNLGTAELARMFPRAELKRIIKNEFNNDSSEITKQDLILRLERKRLDKESGIDTTKLNDEIITENDFKISMLGKGAKLSESNAEYGSRLGLERNFLNPNEYLLTTSQIEKIARKKQPKPSSPYLEEIDTTGYVEPNIIIGETWSGDGGTSSLSIARQQFVEAGLIAPLKSEINQARLKEQFMIKARAKAKKLGISEAFIKMDNMGISPDGLSFDAMSVTEKDAFGFVRSVKDNAQDFKAEQGVYKYIALPFTLYYKKKIELQNEFRRIAKLTDLTPDQIEIAMSSDSNPKKDQYLKKISDKIRSIHKTHPSKGRKVDQEKVEALDSSLKYYVDVAPKSQLITLDGIALDSGLKTMNHEFIHYLMTVGLIKKSEWKTLTNFAKKTYSETMTQNPYGLMGVAQGYQSFYDRQKDIYFGTPEKRGSYTRQLKKKPFPDFDDIAPGYDATYRQLVEEESVAELFAHYTKNKELFDVKGNKVKVTGKPKSLFERIKAFFFTTVSSAEEVGVTNAVQLMEMINNGLFENRTRSQVINKLRKFFEENPDIVINSAKEEAKNVLRDDAEEEDAVFSRADTSQMPLTNNGMPPSNIGYLLDRLFEGKTSEEIDNMPIEDFQNLLDQIGTEKNLRLKKFFRSEGSEQQSFRTIGELKKIIVDQYNSGADENWYLDIGREAEAVVGAENMAEFSSLWAITSAAASPEVNMKDALNIMMVMRGIDINTGELKYENYYQNKKATLERIKDIPDMQAKSGDQLKGMENLYDSSLQFPQGVWGTKSVASMKTPAYAINTLMVKLADYMPFTVMDRWMYRALGFAEAIGNTPVKPNIKDFDTKKAYNEAIKSWNNKLDKEDSEGHKLRDIRTAPKFSEMNYSQYIIKHLSDQVYDVNTDGREGSKQFRPDQIQALIWFGVRSKAGTEGSVESIFTNAEKQSETIRKSQQSGYWGKDSFITVPDGLTDAERIRFEGTRGFGFGLLPRMTEEARANAGKVSVPLVPDNYTITDSEGNIITLDAKKRTSVARKIFNSISSGNTGNKKLKFLEDIGIPHVAEMREGVLYVDLFGRLSNLKENASFDSVIRDALMQNLTARNASQEGSSENLEFYGGTSRIKGSSNIDALQQTLLQNLYIPAFESFRGFLKTNKYTVTNMKAPYELNGTALSKPLTANDSTMRKVNQRLEDIVKKTPKGVKPIYNLDTTSNLAKEEAFNTLEDMDKEGIERKEESIVYSLEPAQVDPEIDGFAQPDPIEKKEVTIGTVVSGFSKIVNDLISGESDPNFDFSNFNWWRRVTLDKLEAVERLSEQFAKKASENDKETLRMVASASAIGMARLGERMKGEFQNIMRGGGKIVYEGDSIFEGGIVVDPDATYIDANGEGKPLNLLKAFSKLTIEQDGKQVSLEPFFQQYGIYKRIQGIVKAKNLANGNVKNLTKKEKEELEKDPFIQDLKEANTALYDKILSKKSNAFELGIKKFPQVEDAWLQYQEFNNNLIEFAKKTGVLNDEMADSWIKYSNYFPFYRETDSQGDRSGIQHWFGESLHHNTPTTLGADPTQLKLKTNSALKNMMNPLEAIAKNSLALYQLGAKNATRQRIVREAEALGQGETITQKKIGTEKYPATNIFLYKENGKAKYFHAKDIGLVEAMQSYGEPILSPLLRIVGLPANILRETVTRDPAFVIVNMMRDTLSAWVTSGGDFTPVLDTFNNFFKDGLQGMDKGFKDLDKYGLTSGYDISNERKEISKYLRKEMKNMSIAENGGAELKDWLPRTWDYLGGITTRSDGATRQAVYDRVLKETGDHFEAAYQALEIINFNRRGSSPYLRVVSTAIPFLNARMQGLDVLYRSGMSGYAYSQGRRYSRQYGAYQSKVLENGEPRAIGEQAQTFQARIGMLMGLTVMYWLMFSDDEEYKNIRREVRDDNWIIPTPVDGYSLKFPIPFEVGFISKVIPERALELAFGDDELPDTWQSYTRGIGSTLKVNPLPSQWQIFKPYYEAYMNNYNTFTQRPVVGYYMDQLDPELQAKQTTNELIRVVASSLGMSPIKLEHTIKGYTGSLGVYGLFLTDKLTRMFTDSNQLPLTTNTTPFVKRFLLDDDFGRGLQTQYYDLQSKVDEAVNSLSKLKKEGRMEDYILYNDNQQEILSVKNEMKSIRKYMTRWRKRRDAIQKNSNINNSQRAEALRMLEIERDKRLAIIISLTDKSRGL